MTRLPSDFLRLPLAHRALHDVTDGRPENSRAAIKAAIDMGYGIEVDLQLSRDQQAMVFHDYSLNRLTAAKGPVAQCTADDLGAISLTGGDETVPTLTEVLALVDGKVPLLIELKDQDGQMGRNIGALEAATAKALEAYSGPVALMSFNPHSTKEMARLCPQFACGITTSGYDPKDWAPLPAKLCDHLREIPDFDTSGASFISHEVAYLNADRVAELKAQGADILCWTVKSPEDEARARKVAANITFEGYLAPFSA